MVYFYVINTCIKRGDFTMTDVTRKLKNIAINSTTEYEQQLLKDFLANAEIFKKNITYLLKNGKSEDGYFALVGAVLNPIGASVLLKKEDVEKAKQLLSTLTETNLTVVYSSIFQKCPYFTFFPAFFNMQQLADKIYDCRMVLLELRRD